MSRLRRVVIGAGLLFALLPASAALGYGGENEFPTIGLSASVVVQGQSITVDGVHFVPHAGVQLSLHSAPIPLGTLTTDANGNFHTQVTIPGDAAPGQHFVEALDVATGNVAVASLTVQATVEPTPPPGDGLAGTGVAIAGLGGLGVVLLLCGQVLLVAGRRRTPRA